MNPESPTVPSQSAKKRKKRKIITPGTTKRSAEPFRIDADDYGVMRSFLPDYHTIRAAVEINGNDEHRRVSSIRIPVGLKVELPMELGSMTALAVLEAKRSPITSIPGSIRGLRNLRTLSLGGMKLRELPNEMFDLTSLKTLNLGGDAIESLPSTVGGLKNLEQLDLSRSVKISKLPNEIGNLTSLISLYLAHTAIESLPSSIGKLKNLECLDLYLCKNFSKLPNEIGNLTSLNKLTLTGSAIESFPPSIGRLENMKSLHLGCCKNLRDLPEEIGDFTRLESLYLNDLKITGLPECVRKLTNLTSLDIRGVRVPELETDRSKFILGLLRHDFPFLSYINVLPWPRTGQDEINCLLEINGAKPRTPFFRSVTRTDDEENREEGDPPIGSGTIMKLWPRMLYNAKYAFYGRLNLPAVYITTKPEAVYQLLKFGIQSFVAVVRDRGSNSTSDRNSGTS